MINNGLFTSADQTWETPQSFFDTLHSVFNFQIDVCAVVETAKCSKYFTPEIDGLAQTWSTTSWCNPPYGREQKRWIEKASNSPGLVVMLIPARPDTKVWHECIFTSATAICFIKGRLKFGDGSNSAPFPSALVVFANEHSLTEQQISVLDTLGYTCLLDWSKIVQNF